MAAVGLIHPELPDLGHSSPTVTGNGAYVAALLIHHERQALGVGSTRCTTVVLVKSILQPADFAGRQMVSWQDLR
jgi:hypothetical protein